MSLDEPPTHCFSCKIEFDNGQNVANELCSKHFVCPECVNENRVETKNGSQCRLCSSENPSDDENVTCIECGNTDTEEYIHICETCTLRQCEHSSVKAFAEEMGAESIAICSTCAIQEHVKKGHDIIGFSKVKGSIQSRSHMENLIPKRRSMARKIADLKRSLRKMLETINEGEKELDHMTSIFIRCRTEQKKQEVVDLMNVEINKQQDIIKKLTTICRNQENS